MRRLDYYPSISWQMHWSILAICLMAFTQTSISQAVGISGSGASPDSSAILDVQSDSLGVLIPRMTSDARESISNPAEGLLVYDLDTYSFWYHRDGTWTDLSEINHLFYSDADTIKLKGIPWEKSFLFGALNFDDDFPGTYYPNSSRMFYSSHKRAFRAGSTLDTFEVSGTYYPLGTPHVWEPDSLGFFSFAGGLGTLASGDLGSTAFGINTEATGLFGSMAVGNASRATATSAFAAGNATTASGGSAFAAGSNTIASGQRSTAMGYKTMASGNTSFAIGDSSIASGISSIAMGDTVTVSGDHGSAAIGYRTRASGDFGSTALGSRTIASGDRSIVIGSGSNTAYLENNIPNSLMVGFNSDIPTLFVSPSIGNSNRGNVGIGTTNPLESLTIGESIGSYPGNYITISEEFLRSGILIGEDNMDFGSISWEPDNNVLDLITYVSGAPDAILSLGNGNVGVGNSNPLEDLTVGEPIGSFPGTNISIGRPTGITGIYLGNDAQNYASISRNGATNNLVLATLENNAINAVLSMEDELIYMYGCNVLADRGLSTSGLTRHLTINGARNASGNSFAELRFSNYDSNNGASDYVGAMITSENSDASDSGDMRFYTKSGSSPDMRMIITDNGNVGIHNSDPSEPLVVGDDIGSYSGTRITIADDAGVSGINVGEDSDNRAWILWGNTNDLLEFGTRVSGTQYSSTLVLDAGNVGIGLSNPAYKLEVGGDINALGAVRCNSVNVCSDIRFKEEIQPISNPMDLVTRLSGVTYFWKTGEYPEKHFRTSRDLGFVAQEVEKVIPEVIWTDSHGYKSIDYGKLTALLIEAMKEQQEEIEDQNQRLERLENLEERLIELEKQYRQSPVTQLDE